jgi:hypothetical protein
VRPVRPQPTSIEAEDGMARRSSWDLRIDEVSGLGRRRNPASGRTELLAVGDRQTMIATIAADGSGRLPNERAHGKVADRHQVRGLPGDLDGSDGQSDWEGIAGDVDGRVFILRETDSRVLIVSPTFEFEGSVALRWDHQEETSLESLLLLDNGHLLSATQERPVRILEFAAPTAGSVDAGRWNLLPADRSMRLSPGSDLHCVASWAISTDRIRSANDLALSGQYLFVLSSLSRRLARFRLPAQGLDALELDAAWPLPDAITDDRAEKAEGLLVDDELGVLVAVDRRPGAPGPNLHDLGHDALAPTPGEPESVTER